MEHPTISSLLQFYLIQSLKAELAYRYLEDGRQCGALLGWYARFQTLA